jgi:hypothetical protein
MTNYTEQQIIKHALQYYITRDGASDKDIKQEKKLLKEISTYVEALKDRHDIK